jgi:UDP-glucuronate 4-epimerase
VRIWITGAAGFIGSHLCEKLLSRGDEVLGLDNFDPFYSRRIKDRNLADLMNDPRFEFVQCDLSELSELNDVSRQGDAPDVVVHLAAKAGVRPSIADPLGYERANVQATMNLLQRFTCGEHRPKFIFASSSSVYGNNPKVPFNEADPVDHPISPYAATKKACELVCHTYHHLYGLPVWCLRFFTVYGPRQRPDLAIHKFTARILSEESIEVFGDMDSSRDYTYIDDVLEGVLAAVDRCAGYEIINLGSEHPVTLGNMIATIEQATGCRANIDRLPAQPGDVERTFADIDKAKRLLDYRPRMDFAEGVRRFVEWYRRHLPDG